MTLATKWHKAGALVAAMMLWGVTGCSGDSDAPADDISSASPEDEAPSEDVPSGETPETEVISCQIEDGLPVAEVKVSNTTSATGSFIVTVQFLNGQTVLGQGVEFTSDLEPGQNETVRMGNMNGDAPAVDECKVTDASFSSDG